MSRKDGYGELYFSFFDKYLNKDLSKTEKRIIECIIRYSWFCKKGKDKKYAIITDKTIFGVQKVDSVLSKLANSNVIIIIPDQKIYAINHDVDSWAIPDNMNKNKFNEKHLSIKRQNLNEDFKDIASNNKIVFSMLKQNDEKQISEPIEDKILTIGIDKKNIKIRKSGLISIEAYCTDEEAKVQAIEDVSKKIDIEEIQQNPDRIHVTIKKYYNQIIKNKPAVKQSTTPPRYTTFVEIVETKMKTLGLTRESVIKILAKAGDYTRQEIDEFLEFEKSNNS